MTGGERGRPAERAREVKQSTGGERWLIGIAVAIVVVCGVLHVTGGREAVGFLSGTRPAGEVEQVHGMVYALAWFGAVVVAPILAIAAACGKLARTVRTWIGSRRR